MYCPSSVSLSLSLSLSLLSAHHSPLFLYCTTEWNRRSKFVFASLSVCLIYIVVANVIVAVQIHHKHTMERKKPKKKKPNYIQLIFHTLYKYFTRILHKISVVIKIIFKRMRSFLCFAARVKTRLSNTAHTCMRYYLPASQLFVVEFIKATLKGHKSVALNSTPNKKKCT